MISPEDSFNQKRLSLIQLSQQVIELAAESSSDEYELLMEQPASTFGAPGNRQGRTADISKDIKHQNSLLEDADPTANLDDAFHNSTGEETLGDKPEIVSPDVAKVSNDPRTNLKQEEADAQSTMDPVSTRAKNSNESAEKADDISVISIHDSSSEAEDNDYPGNLQAQNNVTQTQTSIIRDAGTFWDDSNSEEEESDDEVENSNDSAAKEITRHAHDTRKQSSFEEDSVPPPPPAKPSTDDEDSDATMEVEKERDDEEEGEQTDALQETERAKIAATEAGRRQRQQGSARRKRKSSIDMRELLRKVRVRTKNCMDADSDVTMDDGKEVMVVEEKEETSEAMNSHRAPGQKPVRVAGNHYATRDSAWIQPVLSRRAKQRVKSYKEESDCSDNNHQHSLEQQDMIMDQTSVQQTSKAPVKKEQWTEMKKQKYMKKFACTGRNGVQMKRGHSTRCLDCGCCVKCIVPPWCPYKDSHSCKQRTKTNASLAMSPIQERDGNFVKDDSNGEAGAKIGPAAKQTTKRSRRSKRTKSRTPAKRKSTGAASNSRKKKRHSPRKAAPSVQTTGQLWETPRPFRMTQRCNLEDLEAERPPPEIVLAAQPLPKQEDAGVGNALSPWIKSPAPGGRRSSAPDHPGRNPSHSNPSQTSHEDRINTNAVTGRIARGSHLAPRYADALAKNIRLDVQGVGIRQPEPTPTTQPTTTTVATPRPERWTTPNNSEHPEPATNAHGTVIGSTQAVQTLRLEPTPSKPALPQEPSTALVAAPSTTTTVHADNMDFQKDKDDYQWSTARNISQIFLHVLAAIGLAAIVFLPRFVVVECNIRQR